MIYIACPPYFATGGTELLHQFGAGLIARGIEARMLYFQAEGDPVPWRLKSYAVPFVIRIDERHDDDIIVVPEVLTHLLYEWPGIRKVVWWLSVDFYAKAIWSARGLKRRFIDRNRSYRFDDGEVMNFVQSEHARRFLTTKGVQAVDFLSDYLNDEFILRATDNRPPDRRPVILYNPKKGLRFTKRLMKIARDMEFRAIENMSPAEVFEAMRSAAVYIDFGEHPGKDRIPREAAICGCVVIVGRQGAATNPVDVPIDDMFKFATDTKGLTDAVRIMRAVTLAPGDYMPMFDHYRSVIAGERQVFDVQLDRFIGHMGLSAPG